MRSRALPTLLTLTAALLLAPLSSAQLIRDSEDVEGVRDVGLIEKRGEVIDLSLAFTDTSGRERQLSELFTDDLPVILVLAYFDCPLICPMTINNLQRSLNAIDDMEAGKDYRLLILSFDHRDTPRSARLQYEAFLAGLRYAPENDGVNVWVGGEDGIENTRALSDSVGFYYRWLPEAREYSHPSALVLVRGDGTIHNYIPGIEYSGPQVRRAVVETARGDDPTLIEQFAILCFANRDTDGNLIFSPFRVMQSVGVLSVIGVTGLLIFLSVTGRMGGGGKAKLTA
jgi:protein SCO1/2